MTLQRVVPTASCSEPLPLPSFAGAATVTCDVLFGITAGLRWVLRNENMVESKEDLLHDGDIQQN